MWSWIEFAKSHNLEMVVDNGSRKGTYIEGDFPGCQLKLEIIQRNTFSEFNRIYTRLSLTIKDIEKKDEKLLSLEITNQEFITSISPSEVKASFQKNIRALNAVFMLAQGQKLKGQVNVDKNDRIIRYEQVGVEENADYLSYLFGLMSDTAEAYLEIVELGGEAVSLLLQPVVMNKNDKIQGVIKHLVQDISRDTTNRLAHQTEKLLCVRCLTRCGVHQVKLASFKKIKYYGCRTCQQSRDFIECEGKIVARLDRNMIAEQVQQNGDLQINWLMRDELFDFDQVEIDEVTDRDVERFAIKVGNDTDPVRKSKYKEVPCKITAQSLLSENTIKILKHTFGEIEEK